MQGKHNCLAYALKSLIELLEAGGICTRVVNREVIVKLFIHFFIGKTERHKNDGSDITLVPSPGCPVHIMIVTMDSIT